MDITTVLQVIVNGISTGSLYAVVAIGLTLVFGVMRIVNFAHGDFVMLASYMTFWMFHLYGIDPFLSLALTMAAMALLGVVVQRLLINPMLDAPHLNQILLTFGLGLIFQNVALLLWTGDNRAVVTSYTSTSLELGPVTIGLTRLIGLALACMLTLLLYIFLRRTELGRGLRAVAQDPSIAGLMGVNVALAHYLTFAISAAFGGAAGAIVAVTMYTFPTVGFLFVLKAFAVVILGGMGSVGGAIVAALLLGISESMVSQYVFNGAGWAEGLSFLILMLVLLFRPKGLFGQT